MTKTIRQKILLTTPYSPLIQQAEGDFFPLYPDFYNSVMRCTKIQGPFTFENFSVWRGLHFIAKNLEAEVTILENPSRKRYVKELLEGNYNWVGILAVVGGFPKIEEMLALVRQRAPQSGTIILGSALIAAPNKLVSLADHRCNKNKLYFFRRLIGQPVKGPLEYPVVYGMHTTVAGVALAAFHTFVVACDESCDVAFDYASASRPFGLKRESGPFDGAKLFNTLRASQKEARQSLDPINGRIPLPLHFVCENERLLESENQFREFSGLYEDELQRGPGFYISMVHLPQHLAASVDPERLLQAGVESVWICVEAPSSWDSEVSVAMDWRSVVCRLQGHGISVVITALATIGGDHDVVAKDFEYLLNMKATVYHYMPFGITPTSLRETLGLKPSEEVPVEDVLQVWSAQHANKSLDPEMEKKIFSAISKFAQMEYKRLGPIVCRQTENVARGYSLYKDSSDPITRKRVRAWGEMLLYSLPMLRLSASFAPNLALKNHIKKIEKDTTRCTRHVQNQYKGPSFTRALKKSWTRVYTNYPYYADSLNWLWSFNGVISARRGKNDVSSYNFFLDPKKVVRSMNKLQLQWERPKHRKYVYSSDRERDPLVTFS